MWWTRASVMLLSRVVLTTPAIPHMALFSFVPLGFGVFPFVTHGSRRGLHSYAALPICRQGHLGNPLETIIAIISGITLAAVAGGEQDVGHLARGHEVQRLFSVVRAAHQIG